MTGTDFPALQEQIAIAIAEACRTPEGQKRIGVALIRSLSMVIALAAGGDESVAAAGAEATSEDLRRETARAAKRLSDLTKWRGH